MVKTTVHSKRLRDNPGPGFGVMVENITPCWGRGGGELGGVTLTVASSLHRSRDNQGPGFGVRVEI